MMDDRFIAYYRVSTRKQGKSGLGLEAQEAAVSGYLAGRGTLLHSLTEIESGANNDRPQLTKALAACRRTGATLLIAKIDRLSRDAHFLLGLQKAGVEFLAVDMPTANKLTVGIMALVAEQEREAISARTKAALAAAKGRGVKLGGWRGGPMVDSAAGLLARRKRAAAFTADVAPIVAELNAKGLSLRAVAAELGRQGIRTARGGDNWTAAGVHAVLAVVNTIDAR